MDTRYLGHLSGDPDFYGPLWADAGPADLAVPTGDLAAVAAGTWTCSSRGPWLVYDRGDALPDTGWKVHVAVRPDRAATVVPAVALTCLRAGVVVKTLRSTRLVRLTQGKYAPAAASGKVITAYPADDEALTRILELLGAQLAGEAGAPPLGEVAMVDAPVSVRFGAFRGAWTQDADGRAVPARSGPDGPVPDRRGRSAASDPAGWPEVVRVLAAAPAERDRQSSLDIRDVTLLHRSTGGGVYRAVDAHGRAVVVKEARRHTGFDADGNDAAARLRHEYRVLDRLRGTGIAPEPFDLITVGRSDFLFMEWVPGTSAAGTLATTHPGVVPGSAAGSGAAYRRWADTLLDRIRDAVRRAHRVGVVHRDLHPGNVIDTGERVVLVDWEAAAVDGEAISDDVRNGVVRAGAGHGPAADLDALDRLAALLTTPMAVLLEWRPELTAELIETGSADLEHDGALRHSAPTDRTPAASETVADQVAAGLTLAARPARTGGSADETPDEHEAPEESAGDGIFPSDIARFRVPQASAGLLHGDGGVLLALRTAGRPLVPDWLPRWTADVVSARSWTRGLADGVDGAALCLALLGRLDEARSLTDAMTTAVGGAPWWATGRTGMAVAAAELAGLLADDRLLDVVDRHVDAVLTALDGAATAPGFRPGLLTGWAGVALGLLRVAELVPDAALVDRCRAGAARAVEREVVSAVRVGTGLLTRDGPRLMPYLGTGSAALGLAVDASAAVGIAAPDGVVDQVAETLRRPVVPGAGLLQGRAGVLFALQRLRPADPAVAEHRRRLAWHCVTPRDPARRRTDPTARFVLGEQNLRCSCDLGTGAAGVLLALDGGHHDPLGAVLRLPAAAVASRPT